MQRRMHDVTSAEGSIICTSRGTFLLRWVGYHVGTALFFAASSSFVYAGPITGGAFPHPIWWRRVARRGLEDVVIELSGR